MPDPGPDPSTIASPAAPVPPGGPPGSSGPEDASTPSPAGMSAGEGATPPTSTAGAQQPVPQAGLMAQMMGLAGIGLHFIDMAVRLGPTSDERDFLMHHLTSMAKKIKKQSPPGQTPSPAQLPLVPGQGGPPPGGGAPPMMGRGPGQLEQPGTPNLPRGPAPSPMAGGAQMPG